MGLHLIGFALAVTFVVGAAMAQSTGGGFRTHNVRRLGTSFKFTEGPAWHPDGYIIFSDIPADTIYSLKADGHAVFRKPSGKSNGLVFDLQGRLVACEHGNRRVSRTAADGKVESLASHYDGKRLNSPNDVVVRSDGAVFFTDPPYGVRPEERELDFQGVYRVDSDGTVTLLVDDFVKPNGLAFSPDEKVLYVADTEKNWLRAFEVDEAGGLANGRVLHRFAGEEEFRPDGMKADVHGNLYVAGRGGARILSPRGEHLGTITTPETASNLAFGGREGRTLYITARTSIYVVDVPHASAVVGAKRNPPIPS